MPLLPIPAQSPNFNVRFFSTENGLPNRTVNSIAQDSTGLIWIGTKNGLVSYDGKGFTSSNDPNGLATTHGIRVIFNYLDSRFKVISKIIRLVITFT
ncbi:MAG: ligand-binding sensor domain-containing protein [Neolewinella sp.]|jgi:ligand-binding sensor domain-containing protein